MATITLTADKTATAGKNASTGFSGWNGFDEHLQVGASGALKYRAFIKFPIWQLPSNVTSITDAQLRLTFYSVESPHSVMDGNNQAKLKIGRMYNDWGVGNINPGEGNLTANVEWDWDNRAFKFTDSKISGYRDQTASGDQCPDIDMLAITNDWVFGGAANYGIILINNTTETDEAYSFLFYSGNAGFSGFRPELVITYDTNSAPTDVEVISPANGATINTLTPTFEARMIDPDGDDVSAWRVITEDSNGATTWDSGKQSISAGADTVSIPYGSGVYARTPQITPLIAGHTYDWSLYLWDAGDESINLPSTASPYSFTTNAIPNAPDVTVTPSPLSSVPDSTPTFSLVHNDPDPSDTEMYGYTIVVDEESSLGAGDWVQKWTTGDVDVSGAPVSTVNVTSTTLDWGSSYRVYARTQDSNGAWGSYSSPVAFQLQQTSAPVSLTPSGGTETSAIPTLAGARGSTADTITKFSLRVYTNDLATAMLSETEYTTTTNGNTFSRLYAGSSLIAGDTYRWSAKVYSDVGGYSEWSDWQTFTVQGDASVPTITSPVGDSDYSLTPTITMNRATNFDALQYEVYPESATAGTLGTPHYASGTLTQTAATSWTGSYPGTAALEWATGYKIRARASDDAGSTWSPWSGLVWFATESIDGPPILVSVEGDTTNPAWVATASPYFEIQRYTGDANLIDKMQYQIWNANGTNVIYDSTMSDVSDGSTASLEYTAGLLVPGTTYKWNARYQNDQGPISPWSTKKDFRLNGPPTAPGGLFPPSGYVYLDSETKTFRADFDDPDEGTFGDYPVDWEIKIWNDDTDAQHGTVQSETVGLTSGENELTWSGLSLSTGVNYSWSSRFQDSKGEWGAWSAFQGFRISTPPNGTISTPSDDSTVSTSTPSISWNITGDQSRYTIKIDRTSSTGTFLENVTLLEYFNETDTSDSVTLPAGYLTNGKYYDITLKIWNTDNLVDPSPSTVNVYVNLDAPDPVSSIDSYADFERSTIRLEWDLDNTWTISSGHTFVSWRIRRRKKNLTTWETIADITAQGNRYYTDYYPGHGVNYQYAVYAVTRKSGAGLELVSGDDPNGGNIIESQIGSDDWHLTSADRQASHSSLLVVEQEDHNRPIQQEVFETLGSSRKVIMRGFVLGHEGSLTTLWFNTETATPEDEQVIVTDTFLGKRIVDYITRNPGPHILKSPFGDVWDVQFATPQYQWMPTGHLSVTLEWIETGNTSENDF